MSSRLRGSDLTHAHFRPPWQPIRISALCAMPCSRGGRRLSQNAIQSRITWYTLGNVRKRQRRALLLPIETPPVCRRREFASAKTSSTGDQKATKMLRQIIQEYLIKQAGVSLSKFDDPDLMLADLGLDSLGVVEMLYEVEDRYGFQVQEPYRYSTMRFIDIVADLESTIRAKNNGELPEPKRTEA